MTNLALNQMFAALRACSGVYLIYVENQKARVAALSGEFIWTIYSLLCLQSLSKVCTQIFVELNYFPMLLFKYFLFACFTSSLPHPLPN